MYCTHCGKEISDNAHFCPYCGSKTNPKSNQNTTAPIDNHKPKTTIKPSPNKRIVHYIPFAIIVLFIYLFVGFFTIQPIGALPEGVTCVVLKSPSDPFFDSPDALSLRRTGGVSLLSRGMAIATLKNKTVLFKLPYIHSFYSISVGGREFSK